MGGQRPQDEAVLGAARAVLERHGTVLTLGRLVILVRAQLGDSVRDPVLGGVRLRRLMAHSPFCRMDVRTRKGPRDRVLTRCPVCRSGLRKIRNQTLFGGEVTITLRCPACPYWSGKEKRIPTLYTFHRA